MAGETDCSGLRGERGVGDRAQVLSHRSFCQKMKSLAHLYGGPWVERGGQSARLVKTLGLVH